MRLVGEATSASLSASALLQPWERSAVQGSNLIPGNLMGQGGQPASTDRAADGIQTCHVCGRALEVGRSGWIRDLAESGMSGTCRTGCRKPGTSARPGAHKWLAGLPEALKFPRLADDFAP